MPSRTALILSGGRRNFRGDPIFGFLAKIALRGVRAIAGRIGRRAVTPGPVAVAKRAVAAVGRVAGTRTGRILATTAGLGATVGAAAIGTTLAGPDGEALIDPRTGLPFRRRRRINPLNPRAARRAVRRLCQLQHFTDRLEHSLRSIGRHHHHPVHHRAPPRRRK